MFEKLLIRLAPPSLRDSRAKAPEGEKKISPKPSPSVKNGAESHTKERKRPFKPDPPAKNEGEKHLDLLFRIRKTDIAQRWAGLCDLELPDIREGERFECFDEDFQLGMQERIDDIISLIENIKPLHPEIDFGKIDFSDVQNEVNRIHVNFADRHLVRKDLTKESYKLWNDLNVKLHQLESYLYAMRQNNPTALPRARFTVTFNYKKFYKLTDEDYSNAVLNQNFGSIYLNYSQVGRHIFELFISGDENLPLEHIQPFYRFSADFVVYFGPNTGNETHLYLMDEMRKWFKKREKYFSQAGLSWDPRKLCIGFIPVAQLEEPCYSIPEIKAFQKKVSRFQKVESIKVY